jgi:hypothetical protein
MNAAAITSSNKIIPNKKTIFDIARGICWLM